MKKEGLTSVFGVHCTGVWHVGLEGPVGHIWPTTLSSPGLLQSQEMDIHYDPAIVIRFFLRNDNFIQL